MGKSFREKIQLQPDIYITKYINNEKIAMFDDRVNADKMFQCR